MRLQRDVDEPRVLLDRPHHVALVRKRGGETPMGRQVRGRDDHGLSQKRDGAPAVAGAREARGPVAQRGERGGDVFERGLGARETDVRADRAVLVDELEVRLLGLT